MPNPLIIAAVVAGGFILLRVLMGSKRSDASRKQTDNKSIQSMQKIRAYEQQVQMLGRNIKTAPSDRTRELMAKRMEQLLKQKERLKHKTERLVKRA